MTREELREHCERQIRVCETWSKAAGVPKGKIYDEHKLILELLDNEHKPGKWIWKEDWTPSTPVSPAECNYAGWVCSECGEFPDDIVEWDNLDKKPTYKYCSNCGARMEKEVKE